MSSRSRTPLVTRHDFEQAYGPQLWHDPTAVIRAQLQWHQGGQNGCLFGQLAARRATASGASAAVVSSASEAIQTRTPPGWRHLVMTAGGDPGRTLHEAIADPECQLLSLLWPHLTRTEDLVALVRRLTDTPLFRLTHQEVVGERVALSLRTPVAPSPEDPDLRQGASRPGSGQDLNPERGSRPDLAAGGEAPVLAWIMGFGPFDYMPATRQAPCSELVIRVKPKPDWLYPKHSQDRACAHVADVPLGLDEQGWQALWEPTFASTRAVLGGVPDLFSAARTTFTLPARAWLQNG